MVRYQRNNILFRIASAAAISKFKSLQAHSFGQLSRKEFEFDASAREAVLLSYDRYSQWLYRVERICLAAAASATPVSALLPSLSASFINEQSVAQGVVESNPEIFSSTISAYLLLIHTHTGGLLERYFDTLIDCTMDDMFVKIVDVASNYLQHLLITMHEFNNNIFTKLNVPFISIADFSIDTTDTKMRVIPCLERLKFFKSHGCGDEYVYKFFGSSDSAYDEMFAQLKLEADRFGITLVHEKLEEIEA